MIQKKMFLVITVFAKNSVIEIRLENIMTFPVFPDNQLKSLQSMISISLECLALATKSYYNHPRGASSIVRGWLDAPLLSPGRLDHLVSRTITHNFSLFFHHLPKSRVRRQPCYCCLASRAITSTPELGSRGVLFSVHVAASPLSRAQVALRSI